MTSFSRAKSTSSWKKSRSTQAVVGLCGNEQTITFGPGPRVLERRRMRSRKPPSSLTLVVIGTSRTAAPAKSGPQMWIGYEGDGTMAASPWSSSTHIRWLKPSLAPIVEMISVSGSSVDAEAALVEVGGGLAQLGDAPAGRVAVVPGVAGRLAELVDRDLRRRDVRVAEPQVDDVHAGSPSLDLQPVDDGEDVRGHPVDPAELHGSRVLPRPRSVRNSLGPDRCDDRGR